MTTGRAIAHSEQSPDPHPALLHGVQLWIALPETDWDIVPSFHHHTRLPTLNDRGLQATVLIGELAGDISPGRVYTPLLASTSPSMPARTCRCRCNRTSNMPCSPEPPKLRTPR
ncbi:MAG: hypothetical protein ACRDTJ_20230 [Pseudonocardiaceae bacterium]